MNPINPSEFNPAPLLSSMIDTNSHNNAFCFIEERMIHGKILPILFVVTKMEFSGKQLKDLEFFSNYMKFHDYPIIGTLGLPIIKQPDSYLPDKKFRRLDDLYSWLQLNSAVRLIHYLRHFGFPKSNEESIQKTGKHDN